MLWANVVELCYVVTGLYVLALTDTAHQIGRQVTFVIIIAIDKVSFLKENIRIVSADAHHLPAIGSNRCHCSPEWSAKCTTQDRSII